MMDYLRSLAPHRHGDATRAVPQFTSRFARRRPLSLERQDPAANRDAEPTLVEPPEVVDTPPSQEEMSATHESIDAAPPNPRAMHRVAAASIRPEALRIDTLVDSERPEVRLAQPDARRPVASFEERTIVGTPPQPATAAAVSERHLSHTSGPSVAQSRPAPAADHPLSPSALAVRDMRAASAPPAIHVTIDRIEVRPPASAQRPTSRTRSREKTPAVSLGDYLRSGTRPGEVA